MKSKGWLIIILLSRISILSAQTSYEVSLYKTFERSIENIKAYTNKFSRVTLNCDYTAPSGRKIEFIGFFDGDGTGGGNLTTGSIWKIRFIPDETGQWNNGNKR